MCTNVCCNEEKLHRPNATKALAPPSAWPFSAGVDFCWSAPALNVVCKSNTTISNQHNTNKTTSLELDGDHNKSQGNHKNILDQFRSGNHCTLLYTYMFKISWRNHCDRPPMLQPDPGSWGCWGGRLAQVVGRLWPWVSTPAEHPKQNRYHRWTFSNLFLGVFGIEVDPQAFQLLLNL